jgi:hypothetical protein
VKRAHQAGVPAVHLSSKTHEDPAALDAEKEFVVETFAEIANGHIRLVADTD